MKLAVTTVLVLAAIAAAGTSTVVPCPTPNPGKLPGVLVGSLPHYRRVYVQIPGGTIIPLDLTRADWYAMHFDAPACNQFRWNAPVGYVDYNTDGDCQDGLDWLPYDEVPDEWEYCWLL